MVVFSNAKVPDKKDLNEKLLTTRTHHKISRANQGEYKYAFDADPQDMRVLMTTLGY
jgi:hypothetical protein